MRLFIAGLLVFTVSIICNARQNDFIHPDQFDGSFVRAAYDTSAYGYATNNGFISVFNLDRKVIESFLPPQLALAKSKGGFSPLIVVWGEMSATGGVYGGVDFPYGLVYREMHFFIPGVYERNGNPNHLRTYTPRMFVDERDPEVLGRRFYYPKILLNKIGWNIQTGMETEDWVTTKVLSWDKPAQALYYKDKPWLSVLAFLPKTDIMAYSSEFSKFRCSGFEWLFDDSTWLVPTGVSMNIHRKLVDGMSPEILEKELHSVASFRLENWKFLVDYYYEDCK